jgi:hypothetical protein
MRLTQTPYHVIHLTVHSSEEGTVRRLDGEIGVEAAGGVSARR